MLEEEPSSLPERALATKFEFEEFAAQPAANNAPAQMMAKSRIRLRSRIRLLPP